MARRWWVPVLVDLDLVCISGARQNRVAGEAQARKLAKVYRRVDLVRHEGSRKRGTNTETVVQRWKDGRVM